MAYQSINCTVSYYNKTARILIKEKDKDAFPKKARYIQLSFDEELYYSFLTESFFKEERPCRHIHNTYKNSKKPKGKNKLYSLLCKNNIKVLLVNIKVIRKNKEYKITFL